jgi:arginine:pyruvate transaminase
LAGEAFGPSAAGHIRLGLVLGEEPLRDACQRITRCATELMEAQVYA